MACRRYRVLHHPSDRCQQHAGNLWHNGYTGHPRLPRAAPRGTAGNPRADAPSPCPPVILRPGVHPCLFSQPLPPTGDPGRPADPVFAMHRGGKISVRPGRRRGRPGPRRRRGPPPAPAATSATQTPRPAPAPCLGQGRFNECDIHMVLLRTMRHSSGTGDERGGVGRRARQGWAANAAGLGEASGPWQPGL